MDAIELLRGRNSMPQLQAPAPSGEEVEVLLQAAMRAPDHARLRPYRFIVVRNDALYRLGDVFAEAARLRKGAALSDEEFEKIRRQPLRAPMIVVVVARFQEHPKVPRDEQLMSAGCAAHGLTLAAHALGYGAVWRTGDNAYDATINQQLGLDGSEQIVGYIYLGTSANNYKALPSMRSEDFCSEWQ